MVLTVNGVDITPYIKFQGLKWQLSDLDAPNSGRDLAGEMHRGRVASKVRLDVDCKPLTTAQASVVLSAIYPEWVTVVYTDPRLGTATTKTMYSNNRPASYCIRRKDGTELWQGISFPLIEK